MKPKVIVLGASGQLGQEIQNISEDYPIFQFIFATKSQIDLSDSDCIEKIVGHSPNFIINCAAYTAVDLAEDNEQHAFDVNVNAVRYIVEAAKTCQSPIIHISSDYVYNITKQGPLLETDECQPKGVYARSKYEGECYLRDHYPDTVIIRTSWLYSTYGKNFVKTMLHLGKIKDEISVVNDQIGAPTYAHDLAVTIIKILSTLSTENETKRYFGTYNFANEGITSWYDFAMHIFNSKSIKTEVKPISTKDFGAKAPRPAWSIMSLNKIKNTFDIKINHWTDALDRMLSTLP